MAFFKLGKSKEKADKSTAEAGLEEQVNNRAQDLKGAGEQLRPPSDTANPHGPIAELSVEPDDESRDDEKELGSLFEEAEGKSEETEINVAEQSIGGEGESFSNLFDQDEAEENPLASLINSLPDVTVKELFDDLQEIKTIINDWQQH